MGRITEAIEYLNVKKHPSKIDILHFYTHIEIDEGLKGLRRAYRSKLFDLLSIENKVFTSSQPGVDLFTGTPNEEESSLQAEMKVVHFGGSAK